MSSNPTRFLMLLTTTTTTPSPLRYPSLLRLTRHRHRHHIPSSLSSLSHHHNLFSSSLPHPLKINSSPSHHHQQLHTSAHFSDSPSTSTSFPSSSRFSHPWPEWSNFANNLSASAYFTIKHGSNTPIDELTSVDDLPEEFLRSCTASLAFARDKPWALGMLSRRDIEVVVQNGLPILFKNSLDSVRRMKLFLHGSDSNVPNTDKACTVDLMKFLLSYASGLVSSEKTNLHNVELVESSVRNLFSELAQLGSNAVEANLSGSLQNQFPDRYGQTPGPHGQNIEMKRGDWICPRCSFMNFARNVKCLECDEQRPKGQVTGGEWECPQCDFYNYARNMVCLRCDCKRPGGVSPFTTSPRSDMGYGNGSYVNKSDLVGRLAANEKMAQQQFSNASQMDSSSDRNGAITDELAQLGSNAVQANLSGSLQNQFPDRYGQTPGPRGQNIEMKRGDWICPRCSFMNFARNVKCLECDEQRPKGQVTGGEWECPQCDFYNYARNMVCFRCDCKRPGGVSPVTTGPRSDMGYGNRSYVNKSDLVGRLAANEKKAQQQFSNASQMDSSSDRNGAITDEDFPEIMPLRKGVNRFVVSTRKPPLERRLTNSQYQINMGTDGTFGGNDIQTTGTTNPINQTINQSPASPQFGAPRGSNSNYVPFVPLPADMFAKKPENSKMEEREGEPDSNESLTSSNGERTGLISERNEYDKSRDSWQASEMSMDQTLSDDNERELAEKSERWFKRVAELHNVTDLTSAISDEDFPEIMPLRKGENKFVVSKKKDRSLTYPMYKRHMAIEQANTTSSVPFVPFPPNYFAKKNNLQSDDMDSHDKDVGEVSSSATLEKPPEKLDDARIGVINSALENSAGSWSGENWSDLKKVATYGETASGNFTQNLIDPQPVSSDSLYSGNSMNANVTGTSNLMGNSVQNFNNLQANSNNSESRGSSWKENTKEKTNLMGSAQQSSANQNVGDSWTGKSLEGSAMKEPDPLDMSEEAKTERWFRRVAQIKDISELSQIPDEDFPSIMPMRKGVNRFVVSKRKTPLERRLTSAQYRRNLPIVSSDPVKENDSS